MIHSRNEPRTARLASTDIVDVLGGGEGLGFSPGFPQIVVCGWQNVHYSVYMSSSLGHCTYAYALINMACFIILSVNDLPGCTTCFHASCTSIKLQAGLDYAYGN